MKKILNICKIILIIILIIVIPFLVILLPIFLAYLLGLILSCNDGYLLMGLSFYLCGSILFILIPVTFFLRLSDKKKRIRSIKDYTKGHRLTSIIIILIFLFIEISLSSAIYIYYKDIKDGPKESIMVDAIVEERYVYKGSNTYIIGYIDGKKEQFEITRDSRDKIKKMKKYKKVKIKYYKNLKEVYDIEIYK